MAAPESKLSPPRTQGLAPSVQAETISLQQSVVSIQPPTRLPSVSVHLGQSTANPGGGL